MPRILVGLLAAVGAAMSVVANLAHGDLFWAGVLEVAAATGLAAYLALPSTKKTCFLVTFSHLETMQLACLLSSSSACVCLRVSDASPSGSE